MRFNCARFNERHPGYFRLNLYTSFGRLQLPHLRTLQLTQVKIEPSSLLDFLQAHTMTPRNLSLANITLFSGDWADTLDQMIERMNLAQLQLERFFRINDPLRCFHISATVRKGGKIDLNFAPPSRTSNELHAEIFVSDYSIGQFLTRQGGSVDDLNMRCWAWWNTHREESGQVPYDKLRPTVKIPVLYLHQ